MFAEDSYFDDFPILNIADDLSTYRPNQDGEMDQTLFCDDLTEYQEESTCVPCGHKPDMQSLSRTNIDEDSIMTEVKKNYYYKKVWPIDLVFDFSTITEEVPMTPFNTEASIVSHNQEVKDRLSLDTLVRDGEQFKNSEEFDKFHPRHQKAHLFSQKERVQEQPLAYSQPHVFSQVLTQVFYEQPPLTQLHSQKVPYHSQSNDLHASSILFDHEQKIHQRMMRH